VGSRSRSLKSENISFLWTVVVGVWDPDPGTEISEFIFFWSNHCRGVGGCSRNLKSANIFLFFLGGVVGARNLNKINEDLFQLCKFQSSYKYSVNK
jgi:hypothetical protein